MMLESSGGYPQSKRRVAEGMKGRQIGRAREREKRRESERERVSEREPVCL